MIPICKRVFYGVFEKEEYAKSFMDGNIWTQPSSSYAVCKKEDVRFDKNEGLFEDLLHISLSNPMLEYRRLGTNINILSGEICKDYGCRDAYMQLSGNYNCNILSITYLDQLIADDTHNINVIMNSLKFGKHIVVFDFYELQSKLREVEHVYFHPVIYDNKYSLGPFVKRKKYEFDQEIRFIFPYIHEKGYIIKIPPLNNRLLIN